MNRKSLFSEATQYTIQIDGILNESFMEVIKNFFVTPEIATHSDVTTITGQVKDQAALNGLLNCLYNGRYIILDVKQI